MAELDVERPGGVVEPGGRCREEEDGVTEEEWTPLLERPFCPASTLSSVRKLALDRLRRSERNEGAMAVGRGFKLALLGGRDYCRIVEL